MDATVPQHILDALTDVNMPRLPSAPGPKETIKLKGIDVPVYREGCVVVGSGAA